jgi:hypothetical protein
VVVQEKESQVTDKTNRWSLVIGKRGKFEGMKRDPEGDWSYSGDEAPDNVRGVSQRGGVLLETIDTHEHQSPKAEERIRKFASEHAPALNDALGACDPDCAISWGMLAGAHKEILREALVDAIKAWEDTKGE